MKNTEGESQTLDFNCFLLSTPIYQSNNGYSITLNDIDKDCEIHSIIPL